MNSINGGTFDPEDIGGTETHVDDVEGHAAESADDGDDVEGHRQIRRNG